MKTRILYILFLISSIATVNGQAPSPCGWVVDFINEFGAWLCPNYEPSPGFPGSAAPAAQLGEVTIRNPGTSPNAQGFPITVTGPTYSFTYNYIPCPGDALARMNIAPSSKGNVRGGTFGMTRRYSSGAPKPHDGVDLATPVGTNVHSMHAGEVTAIVRSFVQGTYTADSYGNYITVKSTINGNVVYLKYNHLSSVPTNLMVGSAVNQSAFIGVSGTTGNAHRSYIIPHVHIQGRNSAQQRIDPMPYIATTFNLNTGKGTRPCL